MLHSRQHQTLWHEILPVCGCVSANMTIDILNAEKLRVVLVSDKCKNVGQRSQGTDAVSLRVSFQKTCLTETQSAFLWLLVTGIVYFVDAELRYRSDVFIPTETVTSLCQMAWKTSISMSANLTPTHQLFTWIWKEFFFYHPSLFTMCTSTFSKLVEGSWWVSWRRALISTLL
jgi:hypothetical protein